MNDEAAGLKRKTILSVMSLFLQSGYSAALGLAANLVLTILLSPTIFGIYITVLSLISLLNYFSDVGLAASLIQKKEISEEDISTTFTVQQILIISIIAIAFFATSFIKNFYDLPQEGVYLFWALLISFFISSLKTIPSVFLERKIHFQKIVMVQMIENTVFYLTIIVLAILHFGLMSFAVAVLFRAVVGLIAIYSLSFWIPTVGISIPSLKKLLSFGVPFQASSFLALFKDDLITLFLGKVLGFTGLGYIGWAKKWAEAPIRIIMDSISRVLFPVIARIQDDKQKMSKLIEKLLFYQTSLLAPALIGLALLMNPLVQLIPKYNKWEPALPYFYLFILSAFFSSYSTPFINLFNAIGKVKISFSFMLFWTVATWIFTPLFTQWFGLFGFPLNQLALSTTFVIVVFLAKKEMSFHFFRPIYKLLLASFGMAIVTRILLTSFPPNIYSICITIGFSLATYVILLKFLFKIDLMHEMALLFKKE